MYGYGCFISANGKQPSGGSFDADAQAFFTASGITDLTQKNAVNQLVLDLKNGGFWSGIKALYPFVGGNATAHSYNLKNTSQFQINWYGGVTHASDGVSFNGSNGYGDTGLLPSSSLSLNSTLVGVSLKNDVTGNFPIGAATGSRIQIYRLNSNTYFAVNSETESYLSLASVQGLMLVNRNSSTNQALYKDGILLSNASATSTTLPTTNIFLGARSVTGNTPSLYASAYEELVIISNGVSNVSSLNTILQSYLTTIGR